MKRFNPWRLANLKWIIRNRAWNWYYLVRYLRFLRLHHFGPRAVVCTGFVFLGKGVELSARKGYGRIVLERWVHIGDQCHIRAHEGSIRIGSKTVMGRDNTLNAYLDISIGSECVISDSIYVCDFDHRFSQVRTAIRLQGITKSPVRIGHNVWLGINLPARSFRSLLQHLATLTRNDLRYGDNGPVVPALAEPTPTQRQAFDLIGIAIPLHLGK